MLGDPAGARWQGRQTKGDSSHRTSAFFELALLFQPSVAGMGTGNASRKSRKPTVAQHRLFIAPVLGIVLFCLIWFSSSSWSEHARTTVRRLKQRIEQVTQCGSEVRLRALCVVSCCH